MLTFLLSKILPSFQFEAKLDVGHFLTFITLLAGFVSWAASSFVGWRKNSYNDARNGALRLMLRILRESAKPSMSIQELKGRFDSAEMKTNRKIYCGRNFRFKNETQFEAAVYRLDFEGKIDFLSPNDVTFRVDNYVAEQLQRKGQKESEAKQAFTPTAGDVNRLLAILDAAIHDAKIDYWKIRPLAQSAQKVDPDATSELLRKSLADPDGEVQRKVASVIGDLLSPVMAKVAAS